MSEPLTPRQLAPVAHAELARRAGLARDALARASGDDAAIVAGQRAADLWCWHMILAQMAGRALGEMAPVSVPRAIVRALEQYPADPRPACAADWRKMVRSAEATAARFLARAEETPALAATARDLCALRNELRAQARDWLAEDQTERKAA